ncbi:ROK family protein [Olivibacter sp. CPCC 100613]|uniref:ROK family protein n=1 Tax=Olivibacter sp. CPCC 100613 TaxID=3079931 RepID=UPI002FFBD232
MVEIDSKRLKKEIVLAADIGGSHITVAPVDLSSAKVMNEHIVRMRVDSKGTKEEILSTWCKALEEVCDSLSDRPCKLALAMPGPFDYEKGIAYIKGLDKYENLYATNIRNEFVIRLAFLPDQVLFRNDAEAFLHGEIATGLVETQKKVLGLTLGTGFGAALSYMGETKDLNLGGEIYKTSIADDFFTTRWFVGRYRVSSNQQINGVESLISLVGKDEAVDLIFEEYAYALADFLAPHIVKHNVDSVVFGGNISKGQRYFLPQLQEILSHQGITPDINLARQGEQSAIIGAAFLFGGNGNKSYKKE